MPGLIAGGTGIVVFSGLGGIPMKRWYGLAAALVIVALASSHASAQQPQRRPGGGGGFGANPMMLLGQESVQQELKMTEDQIAKVKEHQQKAAGNFGALAGLTPEERQKKFQEMAQENEKFLGDVLKPEQKKRLDQIVLQQRGGDALTDPKVQQTLGITDDQKEKIKSIQDDLRKTMGELRASAGGDRQEMAKKMQEMRTANNDKLLKLLTDDQKKKFDEMTGPKFTGKIEPPRRPGGNNNN
jgi:hypothetical protein